jgi:hypothetical protein
MCRSDITALKYARNTIRFYSSFIKRRRRMQRLKYGYRAFAACAKRRAFFVGRAVRFRDASPRRHAVHASLWSSQCRFATPPASLTDQLTLPVSAFATVLLTHALAFADVRLTLLRCRRPAHPCSCVRRMRLPLSSRGTGEADARSRRAGPTAYAPASCLAAAQPPHTCGVVRRMRLTLTDCRPLRLPCSNLGLNGAILETLP